MANLSAKTVCSLFPALTEKETVIAATKALKLSCYRFLAALNYPDAYRASTERHRPSGWSSGQSAILITGSNSQLAVKDGVAHRVHTEEALLRRPVSSIVLRILN